VTNTAAPGAGASCTRRAAGEGKGRGGAARGFDLVDKHANQTGGDNLHISSVVEAIPLRRGKGSALTVARR